MAKKPTYLGLLNALALAETAAHGYLMAWADVTDDPDVRKVLHTVAAREGEHGMTFAKRLDELGYSVLPKPDPEAERRMKFVRSKRSDLEKLTRLGYDRPRDHSKPDVFDNFFRDHSIDIRTGELLGRYIAEERDSERQLCALHRRLARRAAAAAA
jgi:rubrerythrin